MSTTTIVRACSPKLILDISNHNIVGNGGNVLGKIFTTRYHHILLNWGLYSKALDHAKNKNLNRAQFLWNDWLGIKRKVQTDHSFDR